jgi:hypothetical protein
MRLLPFPDAVALPQVNPKVHSRISDTPRQLPRPSAQATVCFLH